jgi:hypothetical protein
MSTWRRLALELFPEMRRLWQDPETSYYWIFFDLLPLTVAAHEAGNTEELERIYRFGEWCFKQRRRAPDVWNAAYTAFYEHLVDKDVTLEGIPFWVPPDIFEEMKFEFEKRLNRRGEGKFEELVRKYSSNQRLGQGKKLGFSR